MQKFLQIFILASSVLIFSTSLALTLSQKVAKTPPEEISDSIYQDQEGNLKYATGTCKTDSDCFAGGCSSEYCTSEKDLVSICIWSEDFPDQNVYRCGCWQQNCAWISK